MDSIFDSDLIKSKWHDFKVFLKRGWDQISDEDWEQTRGDTTEISSLIQRRYNQDHEQVHRSMSKVYNEFLSDPNRRTPTEEEGRFDWESDGHNIPISQPDSVDENELKH
jgi:uncharacterized protein YjbJ (UPF0337 family)